MTERLFDTDPYLSACEARVLACEPAQGGFRVQLDRTVFFPRGGGQPCDLGTIGAAAVLDVYEEDGALWHATDSAVAENVVCTLDAARRRRHMQYHLAQHILSAQLKRLYDADTVIARIEDAGPHIELAHTLPPEALFEAQQAALDTVARNLPVRCAYYDPQQAAAMPVRGKITPHERIRLVEIEGFDLNACGGTHCRATGEICDLVITGTKEVRGVFRIYYAVGDDARAARRTQQCALLSAQAALELQAPDTLAETTWAHLSREAALGEQVRALREQLQQADVARVLACAVPHGDTALFCEIAEGDAKHLKAVAEAVCAQTRACVLFGALQGDQMSLIFARTKGDGPNLGAFVKDLMTRFGGRGGGSPILAQGMLPAAEEILVALHETMKRIGAQLNEEETPRK